MSHVLETHYYICLSFLLNLARVVFFRQVVLVLGTFGEVGAKYKNKYRSLTYNIKDAKNDGLFRRILLKDLSPIEVIASSGGLTFFKA